MTSVGKYELDKVLDDGSVILKHRLPAVFKGADADEIKAIYKEAARLTKEAGIMHHVDHEIPLRGRNVCGLHIAANLRVILGHDNWVKSNKFE